MMLSLQARLSPSPQWNYNPVGKTFSLRLHAALCCLLQPDYMFLGLVPGIVVDAWLLFVERRKFIDLG